MIKLKNEELVERQFKKSQSDLQRKDIIIYFSNEQQEFGKNGDEIQSHHLLFLSSTSSKNTPLFLSIG